MKLKIEAIVTYNQVKVLNQIGSNGLNLKITAIENIEKKDENYFTSTIIFEVEEEE